MQNVRVAKEQLQKRVQENRDKHRGVYEQAIAIYRQDVIDWFEEQKENALAEKNFATIFDEPKPEDHTADYDNVLDMLSLSEDEVITLTNQEFRMYVRDDWGWKGGFEATSSYYINKANIHS